jgi:HEAT repeat protein
MVVPELLQLLADERVDSYMRRDITSTLGRLGERTVVPELLRLLADEQVKASVRENIAEALGSFADDEATVRRLAAILADATIKDAVYSALWKVSQRAGLRVLRDGEGEIEIVKMN